MINNFFFDKFIEIFLVKVEIVVKYFWVWVKVIIL